MSETSDLQKAWAGVAGERLAKKSEAVLITKKQVLRVWVQDSVTLQDEVKPTACEADEVILWVETAAATGARFLVFNANWDSPLYGWVNSNNRLSVRSIKEFSVLLHGNDPAMLAWYSLASFACKIGGDIDNVLDAIDAAKSSRFEHGESGPT